MPFFSTIVTFNILGCCFVLGISAGITLGIRIIGARIICSRSFISVIVRGAECVVRRILHVRLIPLEVLTSTSSLILLNESDYMGWSCSRGLRCTRCRSTLLSGRTFLSITLIVLVGLNGTFHCLNLLK